MSNRLMSVKQLKTNKRCYHLTAQPWLGAADVAVMEPTGMVSYYKQPAVGQAYQLLDEVPVEPILNELLSIDGIAYVELTTIKDHDHEVTVTFLSDYDWTAHDDQTIIDIILANAGWTGEHVDYMPHREFRLTVASINGEPIRKPRLPQPADNGTYGNWHRTRNLAFTGTC